MEDFAIEVESYLVPEGHRASFRFSLAGRMNGVDPDANAFTEVEIGEEIEIDGERLRLSYVQVGHGYLNFVIDNVTDGERTIHFGGMGGPAILEDANGHELMPEGGGGNLLGQTSFRFRDVNLDALQRLELSTTTISRLMPGPEPFIIHLP